MEVMSESTDVKQFYCWSVDPDAQHFLKVTEVIDVRLDVYHSIH